MWHESVMEGMEPTTGHPTAQSEQLHCSQLAFATLFLGHQNHIFRLFSLISRVHSAHATNAKSIIPERITSCADERLQSMTVILY